MNYIPVRKENYADSKEQGISCDDVEDLDDQQFIVHTAQPIQERTAAKEVSLSSEEQALHDELRKRGDSIAKENNMLTVLFNSIVFCYTPPQCTGIHPADSDDDTSKMVIFSTNSFDVRKAEYKRDETGYYYQEQQTPSCTWVQQEKVWIIEATLTEEERGIDKTLFIKKDRRDIMLVQVYVDDIIFGSTKSSMVKDFEELMQKEFKMSSMGELTFFLGLQVKQSNGVTMLGTTMIEDQLQEDIVYILETTSLLGNARNKTIVAILLTERISSSCNLLCKDSLEAKSLLRLWILLHEH
ncbi:putative ribonuclease H-like domain-containing protein [Tanacetum coccineum]